jgi:hypothetical protein
MDQATHNRIVSFLWGIADDVLRDLFKRGKYPDVILPMCVLRRLDAVLEPTKARVLEAKQKLEGRPDQGAGCGPAGGGGPGGEGDHAQPLLGSPQHRRAVEPDPAGGAARAGRSRRPEIEDSGAIGSAPEQAGGGQIRGRRAGPDLSRRSPWEWGERRFSRLGAGREGKDALQAFGRHQLKQVVGTARGIGEKS